MALIRTTLAARVQASDLLIPVTSVVGFPIVGQILSGSGQPVYIDNEGMFLVQVLAGNLLQVRNRGSDGKQAIIHDIGAPVVTSNVASDFPLLPAGASIIHPWEFPDVISYGQSGAINIPVQDTKVFLAGTVVQAMTLGAPSLVNNGVELFITNQGALAHTITSPGVSGSTGLFDNGAAGTPFTVLTFAATPGSSIVLMAQNGLWNVVGTPNGVTLT